MSSLADLDKVVGFFSYSRQDDEDSAGALSKLRDKIHRELDMQLGHRDFRLWQDKTAIAYGELWRDRIKTAVAESVFFIPIVTPRSIGSEYCKFEFESFLAREAALGRANLVFPILYVDVPGLQEETSRHDNDVLKIINERQYVDWRQLRHRDVDSPEVAEKVEQFCENIVEALRKQWSPPVKRVVASETGDRAARQEMAAAAQVVGAPMIPGEGAQESSQERGLAAGKAAGVISPQVQESARSSEAASVEGLPPPPPRTETAVNPPPHKLILSLKMLVGIGAVLLTVVALLLVFLSSRSTRAPGPLSPLEEAALKPKNTFKECTNCPEMMVVPSGSFTMGSPASEPGHQDDESPQHQVTIAKPFAVAKFTVTFDEWDACVTDGGCGAYSPKDAGWGRGRRPVINVSWDDAKAYVAWLSKRTGKPYRLLSESEWEYATRAGTTTPYYWGNEIGKNNANCIGCGSQWDKKQTAPVGSFKPDKFGLYDMLGNVEQWVEDCYRGSYDGAPADGSEAMMSGYCTYRILRGGSWRSDPQSLRAAIRDWIVPDHRSDTVGLRVARALNL